MRDELSQRFDFNTIDAYHII